MAVALAVTLDEDKWKKHGRMSHSLVFMLWQVLLLESRRLEILTCLLYDLEAGWVSGIIMNKWTQTLDSSADNISVYNCVPTQRRPCLHRWVPLFALSISKPTPNAGHKYSGTAQGTIGFLGVSPFFQLVIHLHSQTNPHFLALSSCMSSFNTCQPHCPLLTTSKPMHTCSYDLFNGALPTGRVLLFLVSFLPGLGAVSKGASVFPLKEAWCSLLAGCDNGPHIVAL